MTFEAPDIDPVFDNSFGTLTRINFEFWTCNNSKRAEDIIKWWWGLSNVYDEIIGYIKEGEKTELNKLRDNAEKAYFDYITKYDRSSVIPTTIFKDIRAFEVGLRMNNYLKKLLMKLGDDVTKAMI